MLDKEEGLFSVSCRFKFIEDDFSWIFTGLYGPTDYGSRESLWEELGAIRGCGEIRGALLGTLMWLDFLMKGTRREESRDL